MLRKRTTTLFPIQDTVPSCIASVKFCCLLCECKAGVISLPQKEVIQINISSKDGRSRPSPKHLKVTPIYLLMNTSITSNFMFLKPSIEQLRNAFENKLSIFFSYPPLFLFAIFNGVLNMIAALVSNKVCFNLPSSMSDVGWILLSFLLAGYYSCRSTPLRSWQKHNHVIWVYTEWVVKVY